jgi:sterol desaturase/sphingolipid hydroxylase (fatty acid hydroxylase superfamily)
VIETVEQSKASYYADFFVYPLVVLGLAEEEVRSAKTISLGWVSAVLIGLAAWTLIEYCIHRFILHRVPGIARLHDCHHAHPWAYVGTPTWVSAFAFTLLGYLPLRLTAGFAAASAVTIGLTVGYLTYLLVHDAIHRWRLDRGSLLYRAKLRHVRHHHVDGGNYGVTTGFWDWLFGTQLKSAAA